MLDTRSVCSAVTHYAPEEMVFFTFQQNYFVLCTQSCPPTQQRRV